MISLLNLDFRTVNNIFVFHFFFLHCCFDTCDFNYLELDEPRELNLPRLLLLQLVHPVQVTPEVLVAHLPQGSLSLLPLGGVGAGNEHHGAGVIGNGSWNNTVFLMGDILH